MGTANLSVVCGAGADSCGLQTLRLGLTARVMSGLTDSKTESVLTLPST